MKQSEVSLAHIEFDSISKCLLPSENLVAARTDGMTSTPKQWSTTNAPCTRLESLIDAYRSRLKHLPQELKANNLEFLSIVESELVGENVDYNKKSEACCVPRT